MNFEKFALGPGSSLRSPGTRNVSDAAQYRLRYFCAAT